MKTITKDQFLQAAGLLALAHHWESKVLDAHHALGTLLGESDEDMECCGRRASRCFHQERASNPPESETT